VTSGVVDTNDSYAERSGFAGGGDVGDDIISLGLDYLEFGAGLGYITVIDSTFKKGETSRK